MDCHKNAEKEVHVVTGGGGYPGFMLGKRLAQAGHQVRLLDIFEPAWDLEKNMEFIKGSIVDKTAVEEALSGADVVYHLASYGMSGKSQLDSARIEQVNIGGTKNVLEACLKNDVQRLVYTSTYNVVFGGKEIRNGDETLPYLSDNMFTDHYSKTKSIAERLLFDSNKSLTSAGNELHICALRLAGVYGPGETRHLPRIVSYLEQGLVKMTYGSRDSLVDFLHVDNLAQAHALAAEALTAEKGHVASGKAYFISDSKPINNFEFFRPLFEGLGYGYPKVNLPLVLVFYFAWLTEIVHSIVSPVYNFQPILTRTEVYKTGVTHYFSTAAAQRDLGYTPTVQNDLSQVVAFYRKLGRVKGHQSSMFMYYFVNVIIIGFIYTVFLYWLPRVTAF